MSPLRSFSLFLLGPASAQLPAVGEAVHEIHDNSTLQQEAFRLGETEIIEPIEFLKLSAGTLASLYHRYTGCRVIVTAAASTAEFHFVQPASPENPLTYAEAAEFLRKAAILENFVIVPDGEHPDLLVLTSAPSAPCHGCGGLHVYSENDLLPEGDGVISYVMTLESIKAADAQKVFVSRIGQPGAYGSITAIPNASTLVITEKASVIRKLIDLKKEIDCLGPSN